jgi:hypothetical protein
MRKGLTIAVVLAASMAMVVRGTAQQSGTVPGQFAGGFTPMNLTFKPTNIGSTMTPTNLTQSMTPQTQSTKVFDVTGAFHSFTFNPFRSQAVNAPILKPGPHNPLQPTNNQVKPH